MTKVLPKENNLSIVFKKFAMPFALAVTASMGVHSLTQNAAPSGTSQEANAEGPVKDVQEFLSAQGYRYVEPTNIMDVNTASAVIHFKRTHNISPANDSVNDDTVILFTAALAEVGPTQDINFNPDLEEIRVLAGNENTAYVNLVLETAERYIERGVEPDLVIAILKASQDSNTDFQYLMGIADAESSLIIGNEPTTTSAAGPFGVIKATFDAAIDAGWGEKYNFNAESDRRDPYIGAVITAEMARENYRIMRGRYAGPIGPAELKAAHFFGGGQGARFMELVSKSPNLSARRSFPKEAETNPAMFGRDVTLKDLLATFERKMSGVPSYIANPPDILMAIRDRNTGRARGPGNSSGGPAS